MIDFAGHIGGEENTMPSIDPAAQNPSGRLRTLGGYWVVYGIFRLIMAVCLFLFSGTATVMFGALLTRAPNPFALMDAFHIIYAACIVLSVLCGILGLLGGFALLAGQRSGRTLALVAGFLSLCNIPLGTTLGIYTLIVLLPSSAA
jgi:hypothetical protein